MPCEATDVLRVMSGLLSTTGRKSGVICSIMSTSPFISAAVAVLPSGMYSHSTRSTFTFLPPARPSAGSARGT
ncbi:hypothetical protein G6F21_014762 [Rhizopus arrhizus]|nr:hypothetical protein G6F21_014762 [Rhizopus arrhizus]